MSLKAAFSLTIVHDMDLNIQTIVPFTVPDLNVLMFVWLKYRLYLREMLLQTNVFKAFD